MHTRCYLVRHAQSLWNSEHRLQSHSDVPLSPVGWEQAKRLGELFASFHLKAIFTSELLRCRQTAQVIAQADGSSRLVRLERELAEMHLGQWEGLTPEEVDLQFQGAYQQWRLSPSSISIPGAEPIEVFRARVRRVLQRILGSFGEGECVVVTHGGVIAAVLADALQADYDVFLRRVQLDNAGVSALECVPQASHPYVLWVNSTAHLGAVRDPSAGMAGSPRLSGRPSPPASA